MKMISNLPLREARPDDQADLLLWDTPNEYELQQITFYNNAQRVNYRENLSQRINPGDKFLVLHHYLDRELDAIKSICSSSTKPVVVLEGLDCFITYLYMQSGRQTTLFWNNLVNTRKLNSILWILIPHKLAPKTWAENRIKQIDTTSV